MGFLRVAAENFRDMILALSVDLVSDASKEASKGRM